MDGFLFKVIWRFLFRSQSIGVLPWLTTFALLSVAVGVAVLVVTLAVMTGFSDALQEQLVGFHSPIRIYAPPGEHLDRDTVEQSLEDLEDIDQLVSVIQGDVLIRSPEDRFQGGRILAFKPWRGERLPLETEPSGVALGHFLARDLWVVSGDELTLIEPRLEQTLFGLIPDGMAVSVNQTFQSGQQELDQNIGFLEWDRARDLFNVPEGEASFLEVWIPDRMDAPMVRDQIQQRLAGRYNLVTWQQANPAIFEALQLERRVYFLVLALIVLVAAINILSMLVLSILQRRRQIAMMMAMGAAPGRIMRLFLGAGMTITLTGLILGLSVGLTGCYLLDEVFIFELPAAYMIDQLPIEIEWLSVLWIALITFFLGFVSSLYPAWQASKIDPAEVLRFG